MTAPDRPVEASTVAVFTAIAPTTPGVDSRWVRALARLLDRCEVPVLDAALIDWTARRDPQLRPVHDVACLSRLGEAFWGLMMAASTCHLPSAGTEGLPALVRSIGVPWEAVVVLRRQVVPGSSVVLVVSPVPIGPHLADSELSVVVESAFSTTST